MNVDLESSQENAARLTIVQKDLLEALKEFPRESTGVKILSEKMGLHARTLKRIIKGSHSPSYQSILKIYRYLLGTKNDRETILALPKGLSQYLKLEHDNFSFLEEENINFSQYVDDLIRNDSVFRSIYVGTATGTIHKDKVGYEHGQHGLRVLEKMVKLNVVKETEPDIFTTSTERGCLTPETLYELARFLLENRFSLDKSGLRGENHFDVYFEGLTKEAYNEALRIRWNSMNQMKALLSNKDNKGNIPFWTISFTDTLNGQLLYKDNQEGVLQ